MTLAIDPRTDRVIGQLVDSPVLDALRTPHTLIALLTRDGYVYVPRSSVRLEVVR